MSLYWVINLLSLSIPFVVSFHPRIQLYKKWNWLFLAIISSMIPFIIWDIWFTGAGYWGFNSEYLSGVYLFKLPIEEWFFFITIPYACVFTHYALIELFPDIKIPLKWVNYISVILFVSMAGGILFFYKKWYPLMDLLFGLVILAAVFVMNRSLLQRFYLSFLFMLIPFFVVNGILTGTGITGEIVWYNNVENIGVRLGTIPIEDSLYAFSLILFNLFLFELFMEKQKVVKGTGINRHIIIASEN